VSLRERRQAAGGRRQAAGISGNRDSLKEGRRTDGRDEGGGKKRNDPLPEPENGLGSFFISSANGIALRQRPPENTSRDGGTAGGNGIFHPNQRIRFIRSMERI